MRTKHLVPIRSDDVDFISNLSDDLCSLIVSFLPMKEAVATSTLSKRWRFIYASSPSLDFDFSLFPKSRGRKQAFSDFVDKTLELFSGEGLRKFHLSMEDYGGYEPRVEDWVKFAIDHDVQELDIGLPRGRLSKIPDLVFRCGSLSVLNLRMSDYAFELPHPVGLKKLRSLEIRSVPLMKGEFFKGVFENCMLIEEIVIEKCKIDALEIESKSLEKLTVFGCEWVSPGEMKISASNLKCFNYIGEVVNLHCFVNLPSLVEVVLNLNVKSCAYESDEQCSPLLVKLVQMVGNAKVLTLSPWCIEQLCRVRNLSKCMKAQGENVKELVLLLVRKEDCVQLVSPLLRSCVNVEILTVSILPSQSLRRGFSNDNSGDQDERNLNINGKMKNLKTVKLEYIDENKTGLDLIKFLLNNAHALEKMTIVPSKDGLEHAKFRQKVSMFRKASKNVRVEYCTSV
ncbi:F-box/LRR-repeat protein At4g14103-like [Asparagus officinalis]|uniref:F-box/LRR-repeat protein At4g14103-like n=1 Tax=Asparagus officinalis TaxID=4686 RepID=UPI00098E4E8D|nr:F-box/LRR-repeat protein At4g14103-like [Asparagus officinalis]